MRIAKSNNDEIMVTVMVTFYNQKKYVFESLSAIFNQKTNFRYEVICGDDGSNDGTYEELLAWKEKYSNMCTVLQMPRDAEKKYEPIVRVSNNRYNMLKNAKGKYVIFIDGDDYFTDFYKLQKQVDLLEEHPECVACGHPVSVVWEDDLQKTGEMCHIADEPVIITKKIYWAYLWIHADALLFRNIFLDKEDKINKDFFDDNLIACYFIKYGDMIYIPDKMVAYRQITNSSWNKRNEFEKALVNIWMYSESKKVVPEMRLQCFVRCYFAWQWFYKNRKNMIEFEYTGDFEKYDNIVKDSYKYSSSNIFYKIWYEIKYFIPIHFGKVINKSAKIKERYYKKLII